MGFYSERKCKARLTHKCHLCHKTIEVGEEYYRKAGKNYDDDFFFSKECTDCQPIIDEFLRDDNNDEGYNDQWISDWWYEVKCPKCEGGGNDCEKMTHYCRCEKFKERSAMYN